MPVRLLATALLSLSLAACLTPVSVKTVGGQQAVPRQVRPSDLSEESLALLRRLDLDDRLERDGAAAPLAVLNGLGNLRPMRAPLLAASAELASLQAERLAGVDVEAAAGWDLLAAEKAWDYLQAARERPFDAAFDPVFLATVAIYEGSLAAWIDHQALVVFEDHIQPTFLGDIEVRLATGPGLVDPRELDELLVAEELEVKGLSARYRRPGLGTALVTSRANPRSSPEDRFFSPEGVVAPATAVLRFGEQSGNGPRQATLELYDPRKTSSIDAGGRQLPLGADFTAAYGVLLSRTDLARVARRGVRSPAEVAERQGLYLLEPYDPERIPVVMVHGFYSSPLAWMELTNDLLGDAELRSRFQIWHSVYPTGLPFLYSGAALGRTVEHLIETFDPEGDDPATSSMVFIAHSLGGLVTRTLATDSGDRLWRSTFTVPLEEIEASDEDRAFLRDIFFLRPRPWLSRIIFVAVPQSGVPEASGPLGRILSSLVELPKNLSDRMSHITRVNSDVVSPEMAPYLEKGGPTSVQSVDPSQPMMKVFIDLPIAPGIRFNTIAGNRGRPDVEVPTDGYVPVAATHLDGARSERVVPSAHGAHSHPQGIAEIRRILREHLAELEAPHGRPGDGG